MPYAPYQSTWNNPYATTSPYGGTMQGVQPTVQYPTYQQAQQHWHPVGGALKVNGYQSALQFGRGMPPNCESDPLFDAAGGVFYVVTTDGAGVPSVDVIDYSPHVEERPVKIDGVQFVSRKEFDDFTAKVNAALGALNGVHEPVPAAGTANAAQGADGAVAFPHAGGHVSGGAEPSAD